MTKIKLCQAIVDVVMDIEATVQAKHKAPYLHMLAQCEAILSRKLGRQAEVDLANSGRLAIQISLFGASGGSPDYVARVTPSFFGLDTVMNGTTSNRDRDEELAIHHAMRQALDKLIDVQAIREHAWAQTQASA